MASVALYKVLNIEKEEASSVFIFLSQSVFLGLFYGALDVAAYALFLDVYPSSMLPKAYIISGVLGILLTSLYTLFQSRMNFSRFALYNLILIAILAIALRSGFIFLAKDVIVWVVFVLYTPLYIVATLGFWGAVSRVFTLRQGKRIFGLIDSGQILGIILSSYGATFLVSMKVQTKDLLIVSSISIFLALIIQLFISGRFKFVTPVQSKKETAEEEKADELSFLTMLRKKYIFFLASFAGFSMVATFFIHFSFVTVTKASYPDTASFAKFIGAFTGTMMIFSLLIKTFVYGRLMKTYGLRTILLLSPILLGIFTIAAVFLGTVYGYTSASGGFVLFFIILSLTKLFSKALKDSFEVPSFKILYQSIDAKVRYSVQSRVDGTVNEMSAVASGILLLCLASLTFIKAIHFVYFLLLMLIIWIFIAARLYREYRNSLQSSLMNYQKKGEHEQDLDQRKVLEEGLKDSSAYARVYSMEVARKLIPPLFEQKLSGFISGLDPIEKQYAESAIHHIDPFAAERFRPDPNRPKDENQVNEHHVRSADPMERTWAAYALAGSDNPDKIRFLKYLLRDNDIHVRSAAIVTCGKDRLTELSPALIEHLSHPSCFHVAFNALSEMGEPVIEFLEIYFAKTGTDEISQLRIIRLYSTMNGAKVKERLLHKMESFNRNISIEAIYSLKKLKISLTPEDLRRVYNVLINYMGLMAWNISLHVSLFDQKKFSLLAQAIDEETRSNYDVIMDLLAMAYDEKSMLLIRENLDAGTREGAGYALELMDIFVAEELKRYIFPLFEDYPPAEKLRVLQEEYPVVKLTPEQVVKAILNRSRNEVSDYTKIIALLSYKDLPNASVTDDLASHLFNPDINIAETAAWIIYSLQPGALDHYLPRVDKQFRDELTQRILIFSEKNQKQLFFFFLLLLKQDEYTSGLSGEEIRKFAVMFERQILAKGENMKWTSDEVSRFMFIVVEGKVVLTGSEYLSGIYSEGETVITLLMDVLNKQPIILEAAENTRLAIMSRENADEIIFDHPEFCSMFLEIVKKTRLIRKTA